MEPVVAAVDQAQQGGFGVGRALLESQRKLGGAGRLHRNLD